MEKTHYGSIKFTTPERLEFPYIDDIVKGFKTFVVDYCKKHDIELTAVRISINVINQEVDLTNLYNHFDYMSPKCNLRTFK